MFWDSGFFNAGKCRVLLRGELSSPVGELSGVPTSWCELGRARESAFGKCHRQIWFSPSDFCGALHV